MMLRTTHSPAVRRSASLAVVLLSASCIYGAPKPDSLAADGECRRICSDTHDSCVRGGIARQFGLPGVTYDLCRREQDRCTANCRNESRPLTGAPASTSGAPAPTGVVWDEAAGKLRCPTQASSLHLPDAWRGSVQIASAAEVQLHAPDAVAAMQAAQGEPPSVLEAWMTLHGRLSPLGSSPALSVTGSFDSAGSLALDYEVTDGGVAGKFRAAERTVRRAGGYCRVIAVERVSAAAEDRVTPLLTAFH